MIFRGYEAQTIPRHGSLVQWDDLTELPLGVAAAVRNCQYRAESIGMRAGLMRMLAIGGNSISLNGIGVLRYLAQDLSGFENILIAAHRSDGAIFTASPYQQDSVQVVFDSTGVPGLSGLYAQMCQAYNRMLIARGDLAIGVQYPLTLDGATLTMDQASDVPIGAPWQ